MKLFFWLMTLPRILHTEYRLRQNLVLVIIVVVVVVIVIIIIIIIIINYM